MMLSIYMQLKAASVHGKVLSFLLSRAIGQMEPETMIFSFFPVWKMAFPELSTIKIHVTNVCVLCYSKLQEKRQGEEKKKKNPN